MKVVIVNKSDETGGAAVVSRRLMCALREAGADARMLVAEKLKDSDYVTLASTPLRLKSAFLAERLKVFAANGFNRKTLFRIDIASDGVDISGHPWIREADVICLNWVNQGMLSLKGLRKLLCLGKPVVWTMHDMWNMTGICHHSVDCTNFSGQCGNCMLINEGHDNNDISKKTWEKKRLAYSGTNRPVFVAVSNWLADRARESGLLGDADVRVIHNAFPMPDDTPRELWERKQTHAPLIRIVFGAARLDDPIKGIGRLRLATQDLARRRPELAERMELVTFGSVKNEDELTGFGIKCRHSGRVRVSETGDIYRDADIVVSASTFETLPGTLVEGQAYGCIPVAYDHGGQRDIIDDMRTGHIVPWEQSEQALAEGLSRGIELACSSIGPDIIEAMHRNVTERFCSESIAARYNSLFNELLARR